VTRYDLRADIKAVIAETGWVDPGEIAAKVCENVPAKSLRAALREMARDYVRRIQAEDRALSNFGSGHAGHGTQMRPAAAGKSWKGDGIRAHVNRQLAVATFVGDGEYKQYGDCTYENLMFRAALYECKEQENAAWKRREHRNAALLTEHGVQTVRDLPAEVLMQALGDVA